MDTHKYMSEITRKALQIIVRHGLSSSSSQEAIESAERDLADSGVYKDYGSAQGRTRRALFTYFKAYGCLDDSEQLTEIGKLFAENKITVREFSFYFVINYVYKNENVKYHPTEWILTYIYKLYERDEQQAYLTPFDFSKISECDSIEQINNEFIDGLVASRDVNHEVVNERSVGYDVWAKMLVQSGLFYRDDDKKLIPNDIELIKWILDSYALKLPSEMGKVCTGIFENIPIVPVDGRNGDVNKYIEEGKALQAFLFDSLSPLLIQKYIIQSEDILFSEMCDTLCLDDSTQGFYKHFVNLERIVGISLAQNNDQRIRTIGNILASVKLTEEQLKAFDIEMKLNQIDRKTSGKNVLLYGVPGCGKSYTIQREYCDDPSKIERIVFHPDYMNTDLIGQILPTVHTEAESGEKIITYKFTPGPLTRILKKAYEDPGYEYFLIIEEINRGNAPAIFGELFQLLDREPDGSSSYGISNENIADYVYGDKSRLVSLPSNLSILATMNTADQNVFTLDTAFQRRWRMKMIRNDVSKAKHANQQILDTGLTWRDFNEVINNQILSSNQSTMSSEDKRLGAYFITLEVLTAKDSAELFAEKVIKYLWDDAFKFSRTKLFSKDYKSLEEVVDQFVNKKGIERFSIFLTEIKDSLKARVEQSSANNSTEQVEEQVTVEENSEG